MLFYISRCQKLLLPLFVTCCIGYPRATVAGEEKLGRMSCMIAVPQISSGADSDIVRSITVEQLQDLAFALWAHFTMPQGSTIRLGSLGTALNRHAIRALLRGVRSATVAPPQSSASSSLVERPPDGTQWHIIAAEHSTHQLDDF